MTQLQNLGLGSWPRRRAALSPDHVAIEFEETSRTYAQLADRVEKLSGWLADSGVRAGDRVAYRGGNHPALLETLFAATRLGAVGVLINARLTGTEGGIHSARQRRNRAVLRSRAGRRRSRGSRKRRRRTPSRRRQLGESTGLLGHLLAE